MTRIGIKVASISLCILMSNSSPISGCKRLREDIQIHEYIVRTEGPIATSDAMIIKLTIPEEDEECVITMEKISSYKLEFLDSDLTFFEEYPDVRKAQLPCGHSFHALALLYHFSRNGMSCPCCREGSTDVMDLVYVPEHIRKQFATQLEKQKKTEAQESLADNMVTIANILEQEVNVNLGDFFIHHRIFVTMYFYENMDSIRPFMVSELPLYCIGNQELLRFESLGSSIRHIHANLRMVGIDSKAVEIVVATRSIFDGVMALYRTNKFKFLSTHIQRVVGTTPVDGGVLSLNLSNIYDKPKLEGVSWEISKNVFTRLLVHGTILSL